LGIGVADTQLNFALHVLAFLLAGLFAVLILCGGREPDSGNRADAPDSHPHWRSWIHPH
jgi:hypothetical protein